MNIYEAFPTRFLRAADFGKPRLLVIESVKVERIDQNRTKPILFFKGVNQGLVLNKTNANFLADTLTPETDTWPGRSVVLFVSRAEFKGAFVSCLRLRSPKPQAQPRPLPPSAPPPPPPAESEEDMPF